MKIVVAQINPTIGDFTGNEKKIVAALERGRELRCDIVLFSELAISGYPPEDLLFQHGFVETSEETLQRLVPHTKGLMAVIGVARRNLRAGEKPLLNSAAICQDGKLLGFHDKMLLPTYDVFDERRYFEPGTSLTTWTWKGEKIGVLICEDIWQHAGMVLETRYELDPVLELKKEKPDLLLNLSASPYQYKKPDVRRLVCEKAAKSLQAPVVLCAQVGGNEQLVFDGYSLVADAQGVIRQVAKGFEEELMEVDLASLPAAVPHVWNPVADLYRALVLGTRDYFRKQGFQKAILGLSGGIDSALVACIAVEALGKEHVQALALPSQFSTPGSVEDAQILAHNLGIRLDTVPITPVYEAFLNTLHPLFAGKPFDVAEENLQARIRGVLLMAMSNKWGYLVLSTGNKSELAMGYCTLYGDMAGGLAVISDVNKTQVYELAHFVNRHGEVIPRSTLEKPPSAELRPNQKDSDSLPDYAIVDAVLRAYVEECLSAEEIAQKEGLELSLVESLVRKIHMAEYKRRQAAPGIRVTKKAFQVGRRYPIVQKWVGDTRAKRP